MFKLELGKINNLKKKWMFFSLIFISLIMIFIFSKDLTRLTFFRQNEISCYRAVRGNLKDFSEVIPRKGKSIFFHETSCLSYKQGKIIISSRQACSVESAAKMNPNLDIFLLYTSPGEIKNEGSESDQYLDALLSYNNVRIMHLDFQKYIKDSPVEELYNSGRLESSNYPIHHSSDVLRFLSLWKYGGIYLDLDTLVLKSLEKFPLNFCGRETDLNVGSAILSFDVVGDGHLMAEKCLNDLRENFHGRQWGYNGPGVIKRLLQRACGTAKAIDMEGKNCSGFTVYPRNNFFPVEYVKWEKYFLEDSLQEVLKITKNSYILHIWNKFSAEKEILLSSNIPYLHLARKYCPKVVNACKSFF